MGVDIERGDWHLDKRFSIGNILTMMGMMAVIFVALADTKQEVAVLQNQTTNQVKKMTVHERAVRDEIDDLKNAVERLDTRQEAIRLEGKSDRVRMEDKLDRLIESSLNNRNSGH